MITISFIGDIALNDDYIDLHRDHIKPFADLDPFISNSDLLAGNLECVIKGDQGENLLKRPRISTTSETMQFLKDLNLGMVSLATNHIYDHLEDGFQKTLIFLRTHQIEFLGAGRDKEEASRPFIFEKNGVTFCFLNYITQDTNPSLPLDSSVSLNIFQFENCIMDLQKYKTFNFRIILMHWGGNFEGGLFPDFEQTGLARKLIDNGADLIIGHHSHTLQPYEKYKGKYIFYSLGNFCFSDINFEGKIRKMSSLRERESIMVKARFSNDNYTINIIPFRNEKLILKIRNIVLAKLKLRNALFYLLKVKPFWNVYKVYFKKVRPLWIQILRKDPEKSLYHRIVNFRPK